MKLTQEQQDMLEGKYGKGTAYAMKIQVAIGESFDAERMVPGPMWLYQTRRQICGFAKSC